MSITCNGTTLLHIFLNVTKSREIHTLSGRIGKVVGSHAEGCNVARSNPGCG